MRTVWKFNLGLISGKNQIASNEQYRGRRERKKMKGTSGSCGNSRFSHCVPKSNLFTLPSFRNNCHMSLYFLFIRVTLQRQSACGRLAVQGLKRPGSLVHFPRSVRRRDAVVRIYIHRCDIHTWDRARHNFPNEFSQSISA